MKYKTYNHIIIVAELLVAESMKYAINEFIHPCALSIANPTFFIHNDRDLYTPNIVIIDYDTLEVIPFELINKIKKKWNKVKLIALTSNNHRSRTRDQSLDPEYIFVGKDSGIEGLLATIYEAMDGHDSFHYTTVDSIEHTHLEQEIHITKREKQIIKLIASGYKSREIADRLTITTKTVENHRASIMRKVGSRNIAELINYAYRSGITCNIAIDS